MESKDPLLQLDSISGLRNRAKVPTLSIDPNPARKLEPSNEDDVAIVAESSASSPSPSMSPRTPADNVPLSASSEGAPESPLTADGTSTKEPASGPQRTRSSSNATGKGGDREPREKRKRSRVTPEQLTHLERFFIADRSPTAARRKEISELLGMQERQTQIWFQNRRAKAKLLDGKKPRHGDWSDTPPDTPPQLSAGFEADLHSLIHEDQPVSIIPCTDLSIGTWRRIATSKHDLVAYVCEPKRCLTWFIHSAGYGFKMEISFDIITHTEFQSLSPGEGLASFVLSRPPQFYLENIVSPRSAGIALGVGASHSAGPVMKTWKKCSDWTEGTQASHVLRHDLIGSAVQLAHVLNDLREYRTRASIPLLNPSMYNTGAPDLGASSLSSPTTLQIPQPPLASLQPDSYNSGSLQALQRPAYLSHFRKRSSSGPPAFKQDLSSPYASHQMAPINTGMDRQDAPHSASYASTSFDRQASLSAFSYGQRSISDYAAGGVSSSYLHQSMHESPVPETSNVPISHGASHRPFPTGPSNSQYFHPGRTSPSYHALQQQQQHTGMGQQQQYVTPSPPLVSSPYAPGTTSGSGTSSAPPLPDIGAVAQPRSSSTDGVSGNTSMGLPGMPYYGHDDSHRYAGQ